MSALLTMAKQRADQPLVARHYGLLETTHRKRFDDLVNLAMILCRVPVAFIAVEEAGEWHMRTYQGLGSDVIEDLIPLCQHACAQSELTVVSRTGRRSQLAAKLLPVALEMKFAAVVPLQGANGRMLGCLSVMDRVHHKLTKKQQAALWALGRQAATQVELRSCLTKLARANAGQVRAEQALAAESHLLRTIIDSAPDNFYLKDTAGRYVLDNIAHMRFVGAARAEEVLGKTVFDFFPLELAQKFDADDQTVLRWGQALLNLEEAVIDHAGVHHDLLTSKIPIRDEQQNVLGLICISHDITARKQAEVAVAQLAAIVKDSTDAIYSKSVDGIIRSWNAAAERLYGYSAAEIVGRHVSLLSPPERTAEIERIQHRIAKGWRMPTFETERVHKDGRRVEVAVTVSVLRDAAGKVAGASVIARDISELRKKTKELEAMNRRLSETLRDLHRTQHELIQTERLRALGEMASGIAHDFNNALTPIIGFSELLLTRAEDACDPDKLGRYLESIHARAMDATRIVARLRDFYRFREDDETLRAIDLNRVIGEALALVRPKLETEAVATGVTIQLDSALQPVPVVDLLVPEVREAITNLLVNAIDALIRKRQPGTLRLVTRLEGEQVILEVIDTGIGMNAETRQHCLEPFFTTKSEHGSGLGLAMVYGMIKRHNGTVTIESVEGAGTTVGLRFPVQTKREINGYTVEAGVPARPMNLLLVDDEPDIREVAAEFLKMDGHRVDTASSGPEALTKLQGGNYDLVVTDRAMPEMNGEQLAQAIKTIHPALPVVLLTGFGDMMNAAGEKPACVDLVLGKPISMAELRQTLTRMFAPR